MFNFICASLFTFHLQCSVCAQCKRVVASAFAAPVLHALELANWLATIPNHSTFSHRLLGGCVPRSQCDRPTGS